MRRTIFIFAIFAAGLAPAANAVVIELSAESNSVVRLYFEGIEDSSDDAIEIFGPDSGVELPILTTAELDNFSGTGEPDARGVAIGSFDDPTRETVGRNPEEIALEADCFSGNGAASFELASSVVERRVIRFSAQELGNPAGNSRRVQSAFFPSGAIFAWSLDGERDLTGLSAEVSFTIRRFRVGPNGQEQGVTILIDETVSLSGGPGGAIEGTSSAENLALFFDLIELPDALGLPLGDVSAVEASRIAVIPEDQSLPYEYTGTVDEEFILEAVVTTQVVNLPDGTGVVAVFGRPLDEAANIISLALEEETAKAIQARINRAIKTAQPDGSFKAANPAASVPCGMFGLETLSLILLGFGGLFVTGRSH
jgi:hypothetical protein